MDWVFREYSNPFSLLDSLIQSNRFNEWIDVFAESHNRKIQWEFWLHKDFEHSWDDYIQDNDTANENQSMTKEQKVSIVQDSYAIMKDFEIEMG